MLFRSEVKLDVDWKDAGRRMGNCHLVGHRMGAKIEKMQEMINKDLEELKNKQTEMNNK